MPRRSSTERLRDAAGASSRRTLRRQAFTHASWVEHRAESYERLAFLGDVVLSLAVSTHLYPRFERHGAGRLTKVRAQAVSGASCARVAAGLGVPDELRAAAPPGSPGRSADDARRVRARARVGLRGDHRRRLPRVRLRAHGARRGRVVRGRDRRGAGAPGRLQVGAPGAPGAPGRGRRLPHGVRGRAGARPLASSPWPRWRGRSSAAERERPRRARSRRPRSRRSTRWTKSEPADASALDLDEGLQVLPAADQAGVRHGRVGGRRAQRLGQVEHHRRRALGARRAVAAGRARPDDEGRDLRRRPRRAGFRRPPRSRW